MADLILFNANIIPMDSGCGDNRLVAIRNGTIIAVAGNDTLEEFRHVDTRVIDCEGKTLLPGFIDCHCHIHASAESLVTLDLSPANNVDSILDIQSKVQSLAEKLPPGSWIRGKGYNEFYLAEKRHPLRRDLDKAAPNHPVKITHRSGHAHVLNSLALDLAGISGKTPEPPGGLIDRELETGDPSGLLFEMGHVLSKVIPPLDKLELERGIRLLNTQLLSLGITSIQDASIGNDVERWNQFRGWKEEGLLKPRVGMMLGVDSLDQFGRHDFSSPLGEGRLRLSGVKIILDETTGRLHPPQAELNEMVLKIHRLGMQVAIHAIEETAVESACSAIAYALKESPDTDHRHHIEHCSVCPPSLAKRLASFGILVVTQPSFIYYNGDRYLETVPAEQMNHLYAIKTLLKNGVHVAGSSDSPIVPANPMIGIYAAVSRGTEAGNVLTPEQGVVPLKALQMYTSNAAEATFEEKIKGSISPGKMADIVVLSGDPTRVSPDAIKDLKVEMTILNGEVVWEDKA